MKRFKRFIIGTISSLLIVIPIIAVVKRQDILDFTRLYNYKPSSEVIKLADDTTMKGLGRKLFYVNRPLIQDKFSFAGSCSDSEQTIVLGCYINIEGIYLLNVDDDRLHGIEEVTAAHEMLHAAYERLNKSEKQRIDMLLQDQLAKTNDARINESLELYRKKDPTIVANELHSILPTEVRALSPELETYYAQYFDNRVKIVEYSEKYESEFSGRKKKIEQLEVTMLSLKTRIDAAQVNISNQKKFLDSERSRLEQLTASNRVDEYNAAIPTYNAGVGKYNVLIDQAQRLIDDYNAKVEEHNKLASEQKELIKAIDSRIDTP